MTFFTDIEKAEIIHCEATGQELNEELYEKLYNHFVDNGQMPYGTAKARTGDPYNWVAAHMTEVL